MIKPCALYLCVYRNKLYYGTNLKTFTPLNLIQKMAVSTKIRFHAEEN